jgi:hypothetical protein
MAIYEYLIEKKIIEKMQYLCKTAGSAVNFLTISAMLKGRLPGRSGQKTVL